MNRHPRKVVCHHRPLMFDYALAASMVAHRSTTACMATKSPGSRRKLKRLFIQHPSKQLSLCREHIQELLKADKDLLDLFGGTKVGHGVGE